MKKLLLIGTLIATMTISAGCGKKEETTTSTTESSTEVSSEVSSETTQKIEDESNKTQGELIQFSEMKKGEEIAILKTNFGDIKMRFFKDLAPKAVENFLTHAKEGYYDNLIFHRVIDGFVIQGGDPKGNGTGGESIWGKPFEDEITPELRHFYGAVAMANSGPNTNGSQFYIVQNNKLNNKEVEFFENAKKSQDDEIQEGVKVSDIFPVNVCDKYLEIGGTPSLDGGYSIFGQVYEGMDVVEKIAKTELDGEKPKKDVVIEKIIVEEYK